MRLWETTGLRCTPRWPLWCVELVAIVRPQMTSSMTFRAILRVPSAPHCEWTLLSLAKGSQLASHLPRHDNGLTFHADARGGLQETGQVMSLERMGS